MGLAGVTHFEECNFALLIGSMPLMCITPISGRIGGQGSLSQHEDPLHDRDVFDGCVMAAVGHKITIDPNASVKLRLFA